MSAEEKRIAEKLATPVSSCRLERRSFCSGLRKG